MMEELEEDLPPIGDGENLGYQIERTATIVYLLALGRKMTTRQLMQLTGLSRQGVWYHMSCISRTIVPVTQIDKEWQLMTARDVDRHFQERIT